MLAMFFQRGCSSVDRVLASEAKGRGFDPRQPRHAFHHDQCLESKCDIGWPLVGITPSNDSAGSADSAIFALPRLLSPRLLFPHLPVRLPPQVQSIRRRRGHIVPDYINSGCASHCILFWRGILPHLCSLWKKS